MEIAAGHLSEVGRLVSVVVKHARDAFVDERTIAEQWQRLNFTASPDLAAAIDEYERFLDILRSSGATVHFLPRDPGTTLDSIYARDASIVSPRGLILCSMGKPARESEPEAQERAFRGLGPEFTIAGRIHPPGLLEGGDVVWLDAHTLLVGRGYRTNGEGIRQFMGQQGGDRRGNQRRQHVEPLRRPMPCGPCHQRHAHPGSLFRHVAGNP